MFSGFVVKRGRFFVPKTRFRILAAKLGPYSLWAVELTILELYGRLRAFLRKLTFF